MRDELWYATLTLLVFPSSSMTVRLGYEEPQTAAVPLGEKISTRFDIPSGDTPPSRMMTGTVNNITFEVTYENMTPVTNLKNMNFMVIWTVLIENLAPRSSSMI